MHVHPGALAQVEAAVRDLFEHHERVELRHVRDALGTSRKYAQAYLEQLDATRVTLRVGDHRVLRSRAPR
jgi:selenocysteine-specific elongation factor